jgi:sugar/nucleoside kinase (ribokinase family)
MRSHRAPLEEHVQAGTRFDYTAVGHVTADVFEDGSRRPGGGALYSALQAARLGQRTRIITQGVQRELEALLEPFRDELTVRILPAPHTTTLHTSGAGPNRTQRVLAWAGTMDEELDVDTTILHLAPVARETAPCWRGSVRFVGLTPQGLVRMWAADGDYIAHTPLAPTALPARCDAIVISEAELESCSWLLSPDDQRGGAARPLVAVTAAHAPTALHLPDGKVAEIPVAPVESFADDLGAGDVFAAAFFIALTHGAEPLAAATFASAAAAVRIAGVGPQAIGHRAAIERRALSATPGAGASSAVAQGEVEGS